MDAETKKRFTDDLLAEAARRYRVSAQELHLLGDFDSFVYEFEREGESRILRISHSSRRSVPLVRGELDWIRHLVREGASVCGVVPSGSGRWLETVDDSEGDEFLVAAFEKADGRSPQAGEWTPAMTESYGALLGRIHRLSRLYSPPHEAWRRPDWDHPAMLDVDEVLSSRDDGVVEVFRRLLSTLRALPRDEESYGLIHLDAHGENLKTDSSGRITLYDCYDCAYSWYVNDVAIVLFYAAMWERDRAAFTDEFLRQFLTGYLREHELEPSWLQEIPKFLKLREIDLYAVILREFGSNWQDDPWTAGYMRGRKERIEAGTPYIDYDFSHLADEVFE